MVTIFSNKKTNYSEQTINILRLARSENITARVFFEIIKFFGNINTALENIQDFSIRGGKLSPTKLYSQAQAENEIKNLEKMGAKLLTYKDAEYPKLLLHISDSPPILSYKGDVSLLNKKVVGVVGARNASAYGVLLAQKITNDLSKKYNITIISGLARGIDTAAHEASLPQTIAVLAGGIDHIYPLQNQKLYHQIMEQGIIISELPIKAIPASQNFPQRNRIIAGISLGVVVIEAKKQSGSLITARAALEQGREVFAVPGFPLDPRSSGCNQLIKQGAHIVESAEDVVNNLPVYDMLEYKLYEENTNLIKNENMNKMIDYNITESMRKKIINSLSLSPIDIDIISNYTDLPLPVIYTILLELELADRIIRYPGNKIGLKYEISNS